MSPISPHWQQPSHPSIQEILINIPSAGDGEYTTKSLSKVSLPPFAVFAKLSFPPCEIAPEATYATVQMGPGRHLNLNSDLLYINHSCDPSLIFDMSSLDILVGPKGLKPGDELAFFYPSTEWDMAQPFTCLCGTSSCRGTISGAQHMKPSQLEGYFLNAHIRNLLEEKAGASTGNGHNGAQVDATGAALKANLVNAEQAVEAARFALEKYLDSNDGSKSANGGRRGPTSRELSGEMGGDTRS